MSNQKNADKKMEIILTIFALITIAFLEYIFFAKVLFNDKLIGETNDSRLNNLLVEHWYHVFCGQESFSVVNIFYPMPNTVAFTDMLVGFAIPYSILRAFGMNMFLANKIVLILFHVFGSYSFYYLLNKKFKISSIWALVGVVIFSYSSAYYVRIGHTQLIAISLIPLFIIMLYSFFEYFANKKKRIIYGFLTVTSYVFIMYTSWYTAFFTALFMVTIAVVYFVVSLANKNNIIKIVWAYIKKCYKEVLCYIVYTAIIATPFFMLYLPVSKMFGKRTYAEIVSQLPELIDFFNVSTSNRMLGWLMEKLNLDGRAETNGYFVWELMVGFSIFVIGLLVFLFFYIRRMYLKQKYVALEKEGKYTNTKMIFRVSLIYSVFVSFLLLVQSNGASLWLFVYLIVPGASAIRAVVRYNFFLTIPIAMIIATEGYYFCKKYDLRMVYKIAIPILLAGLIWYSNLNKEGIQAIWTITEEQRQLSTVSAPPSDCEAMYIVDTNPSGHTYYGKSYTWIDYQHFAWEICEKYHLKNLNGYSGQFPVGWKLENADNAMIHKYASDWIEGTNVTLNVYYYDCGTDTWHKYAAVDG